MQHPATRANGQRGGAPFKKNDSFKAPAYNAMNFNANQMPDNPGYMDFNDPTPAVQNAPVQKVIQKKQQQKQQQQKPNSQRKKSQGARNNKGNKKQAANNGQANNRNWQGNKFNGPQNERFGFKPPQGGPPRGRPLPLGGPRGRPPLPPVPHGFPPRPPMPLMGRGGLPIPPLPMAAQPLPPPQFLRRSARGMPNMPLRPPMPPMMPVPLRMGRGVPPIPFGNGDIGKLKKTNGKAVKKQPIKGKSTIKTLKNIVNQYPLDRPWVTNEIRAQHEKKVDIENRLKGNKNDELFAQFKVQRDKFVALYENAREEYTKQQQQQKQQSKTNDANVNQTTELDGNCSNQEAISN